MPIFPPVVNKLPIVFEVEIALNVSVAIIVPELKFVAIKFEPDILEAERELLVLLLLVTLFT
jgi:hypothetical protein